MPKKTKTKYPGNKNREEKITKKRKLHRLIAWLLAIAMLSGYVPQGISLKGLNLFKNMGKVQAQPHSRILES